MKQTLYIVTLLILMTSCATIMNQTHKNITVYTTEPSEIIFQKDTIKTLYNKANLNVERKNEKLQIVANNDSITKTFEIEPRNSFMYWSNIFCNYGIGMLVDRNNPMDIPEHTDPPFRAY